MSRLLTLRQYAKHRGVTPYAVTKAIRDGRIEVAEKRGNRLLIDPVEADRMWEDNSDKAKQIGGYTRVAGDEPSRPQSLPPPETPMGDLEEVDPKSFAKSRALKELYQAKMAKLTYERMAGTLVLAEDVQKEAFRIARIVRESIMNVPDRISNLLAGETDPRSIHIILADELTKALEELSR